MDAIDFGLSAKNKVAAIDFIKMYAMDTPCEQIRKKKSFSCSCIFCF